MIIHDKQMDFAVIKYEKENPFMVDPLICSWTYHEKETEKLVVYYDDKRLGDVLSSLLMQIEMITIQLSENYKNDSYKELYEEFQNKLFNKMAGDDVIDLTNL